jgi:purine-binding chemotaxis protein CheW
MHAVLLPVGRDLYALPIDWVRQTLVAPLITPLVTAPPPVLGLFNLRGQIVPLLDTAALLGIGAVDAVAFAVVLDTSNGPVALAATAVPERISLDPPATASALPGTSGTFCAADRVVVLLDPGVLLASAALAGSSSLAVPSAATVN